jgi:flagellar hook-associated protein 3 FlgL
MQRITELMTSQTTLYDLNSALSRVTKTQAQLSSGKRITEPSDDPYGASLAVQLNSQLDGLDSYNRNVGDGTAWTQATDSSLMSMNDIVQRVRELTVGAANGTNNASNLASAAGEVDQLTDALKQAANATYNAQYIFSGTANKQPYANGAAGDAYQGNSGPGSQITRQIGPGATNTVTINTDVSGLLGQGLTGPGDNGLLTVFETISNDMKTGNTANLGTDLKNLDTNMSTLQGLQANVGATESRLTLASSRISDLQLSTTQILSNDEDVDMAKASIDFSTEQAAYTAALQSSAKIVQQSLLNFLQ